MKKIDLKEITAWHESHADKKLDVRYFNLKSLLPYLKQFENSFLTHKIGESFESRDIYKVTVGHGDIPVLLWTQMHGNESTGTRAFLDLLLFFKNPGSMQWLADHILKSCTVHCIPMLNPDGAEAYTRVNAQDIDLNRDVLDMRARESRILQEVLRDVDPRYCFNLHDQRTIFSVSPGNETATISFLAPSVDAERTITEGRKETMRVISAMNSFLQRFIPGRIGRYTDEFYPTATGDNFQKMGHNTILIESGHSPGDYQRREARRATFLALLEGLRYIASDDESHFHEAYFDIPNNEKNYLDVIVRNVKVSEARMDIGVLFIENLSNGSVKFTPSIDKTGDLSAINADVIINGSDLEFSEESDVNLWLENKYN